MKKRIISAIIYTMLLTVCFIGKVPYTKKREPCLGDNRVQVVSTTITNSRSREIFDMLTPELISYYETYIAKEKVVTGIKPQKLIRLTETYNVSENKMFALIIVQDIASKNKQKVSLTVLSEKSDNELIAYGREQFVVYIEGLPEEEKQMLAEKFEPLKKNYKLPAI